MNALTIKKRTTSQAISYSEVKDYRANSVDLDLDYRANSVDLDKVAHHEPPHQDPCCLQIQPFLFLVLKELTILSAKDKNSRICKQRRSLGAASSRSTQFLFSL